VKRSRHTKKNQHYLSTPGLDGLDDADIPQEPKTPLTDFDDITAARDDVVVENQRYGSERTEMFGSDASFLETRDRFSRALTVSGTRTGVLPDEGCFHSVAAMHKQSKSMDFNVNLLRAMYTALQDKTSVTEAEAAMWMDSRVKTPADTPFNRATLAILMLKLIRMLALECEEQVILHLKSLDEIPWSVDDSDGDHVYNKALSKWIFKNSNSHMTKGEFTPNWPNLWKVKTLDKRPSYLNYNQMYFAMAGATNKYVNGLKESLPDEFGGLMADCLMQYIFCAIDKVALWVWVNVPEAHITAPKNNNNAKALVDAMDNMWADIKKMFL